MRWIYREVKCHGMRLRGWPKIEKSGKCLSVAYTLEQGEKGDDDDDVYFRLSAFHNAL